MMRESLSKSERTRQFIIEKTAPIFNAKGFVGTFLSDMTAATGLTKGSIYGNFSNKDEVAIAAFDYNFECINVYVRTRILQHENAIDRLCVYPAVYRDFLRIPFLKTGCPILNTSTEADDTHPALRERAASAITFWKKAIENQVKRGIERGEIQSHASPTQIAVVIISMVEGAIMQAKATGRPTELRIAMNFLETFLRGLST